MSSISLPTEIASNVVLLGSSFFVVAARFYVRLGIEKQRPYVTDYLTLLGWLILVAYFICNLLTLVAGGFDADNPDEWGLKILFTSSFLFDMGVFFPKASILAFYWRMIPFAAFPRLQYALCFLIFYVATGFILAFCLDAFWCQPMSDNWSPENFDNSVWYAMPVFQANFAFNFGSDLMIFALPFFFFCHLSLSTRKTYTLVGVFSFGLATLAICIARYVWQYHDLDMATGNILCTAEISCGIIAASLPHLRPLLHNWSNGGESTGHNLNTYNYNKNSASTKASSKPSTTWTNDSAELVIH